MSEFRRRMPQDLQPRGLSERTTGESPIMPWVDEARCRPSWPESSRKARSRKTYGDSGTQNPASLPPNRVGVTAGVQSEIPVVIRGRLDTSPTVGPCRCSASGRNQMQSTGRDQGPRLRSEIKVLASSKVIDRQDVAIGGASWPFGAIGRQSQRTEECDRQGPDEQVQPGWARAARQ